MTKVTLDFETTIINRGHPFTAENFSVSYAVKVGDAETTFHYHNEPDFITRLRDAISGADVLVLFSGKFDYHWLWRCGVDVPRSCKVFDVALAEYVLTGQKASFASLDECLAEYGYSLKFDKIKEYWKAGVCTQYVPYDELKEYNVYDVDGTAALHADQLTLLSPKQLTLVYQMGDDLKALAHAEQAGIKFDHARAVERATELAVELQRVEAGLRAHLPELPSNCSFNWDSGDQLSAFLYGGVINYDWAIQTNEVYKSGDKKGQPYVRNSWQSTPVTFQPLFKPLDGTEVAKTKDKVEASTRYYQTDDPTLKQLAVKSKAQREVISLLKERAKLIKVVEMIQSFQERCQKYGWGDYIHGRFNQNVVATGRLSSSDPNLQNTPPEVDELLVSRYD